MNGVYRGPHPRCCIACQARGLRSNVQVFRNLGTAILPYTGFLDRNPHKLCILG